MIAAPISRSGSWNDDAIPHPRRPTRLANRRSRSAHIISPTHLACGNISTPSKSASSVSGSSSARVEANSIARPSSASAGCFRPRPGSSNAAPSRISSAARSKSAESSSCRTLRCVQSRSAHHTSSTVHMTTRPTPIMRAGWSMHPAGPGCCADDSDWKRTMATASAPRGCASAHACTSTHGAKIRLGKGCVIHPSAGARPTTCADPATGHG